MQSKPLNAAISDTTGSIVLSFTQEATPPARIFANTLLGLIFKVIFFLYFVLCLLCG
jgi:hypothetical protein